MSTISLLIIGFAALALIVILTRSRQSTVAPQSGLDNSRSALTRQRMWISLPTVLIDAFASRFDEFDTAARFVARCDESGITKRVVRHYACDHEPTFVIRATAIALTSYGNACASSGKLNEAKEIFELALVLEPEHSPALGSLCMTEFELQNYAAARDCAVRFVSAPTEGSLEDRARTARALGIENYLSDEASYRRQIQEIKRHCDDYFRELNKYQAGGGPSNNSTSLEP